MYPFSIHATSKNRHFWLKFLLKFKKFLPAAPVGTAGSELVTFSENILMSKKKTEKYDV